MAGEFVHADVGGELTEAEYHSLLAHILNSQARGDLVMSDAAATGLVRLPKGARGRRLVMGANDPGWDGTASEAELTELTDGSTTVLHSHAGSGPWTLEGSVETEQTTTSTSNVDIATVSGLSIAAGRYILVIVKFYRSAFNTAAYIGLTMNAADVITTIQFDLANVNICHGFAHIWLPPRDSNYGRSGAMYWNAEHQSGGGAANGLKSPADTNGQPNATVTDIIIRGRVGSASATLAVNEVVVMSPPTS